MIELRHLRHAIAAEEHRSFRKAALSIHVRQSTLSRQVHELEDMTGITVFERSPSGVRPTPEGEAFLRTARHIVEEADTLAARQRYRPGTSGRLSIGFYSSLSAGNLRAALIDYRQRFPLVTITLTSGPRQSLLAALSSGAIDCAIVTANADIRNGPILPLWSERVIVALPQFHPLADRTIVYWIDLKDEQFLMSRFDPGPELEGLLATQLAPGGRSPHVVRHDLDEMQLMPLVGTGLGVTLACESSLGARYDGVVYRELRNGDRPSRLDFVAYWRYNATNSALRGLLNLLRERHPEIPAAPALMLRGGEKKR